MRADPQPDWHVSAKRDGKLPPTPVETQWASGYAPVPRNRPKKIMKAVASFIGGAAKFVAVSFVLIAGLKSLGIDQSGTGGQ